MKLKMIRSQWSPYILASLALLDLVLLTSVLRINAQAAPTDLSPALDTHFLPFVSSNSASQSQAGRVVGWANTSDAAVILRTPGGPPQAQKIMLPALAGYLPGDVTCRDTGETWVVGNQAGYPDPAKPAGIILCTSDGGQHWTLQTPPLNSSPWKILFASLRR